MIAFSPIERSRAHLALTRALGVSNAAHDADTRARQNYSFWVSHDPRLLHDAGVLAEALTDHAQRETFSFRLSELAVTADSLDMAECAAGLVGALQIGRDLWSTATDERAPLIPIPKTLLREHLELWVSGLPFED